MKKVIVPLLAVLLVFAISGCSGNTLKVGVSAEGTAPYAFENTSRQYEGLDVDLAKDLASLMGRKTEIVQVPWGDRQAAIEDGTVDILIGGLTAQTEAGGKYLTESYLSGSLYVVLPQGGSDFTTDGKRVGVLKESAAYYIYGMDTGFRDTLDKWAAYGQADDLFQSLEDGEINLVICDVALANHMAESRGVNYALGDKALCQVDYVISARSEGLLKKIQKQLDKMVEDGTGAELSKTWLGENRFK